MRVRGHLSHRLRLNFRSKHTPEPPGCQSVTSALVEYGAASRVWERKRGSFVFSVSGSEDRELCYVLVNIEQLPIA